MATPQQTLSWIAGSFVLVVTGLLTYHLTPVLVPFLVAAAFAYLTDPLVEGLSLRFKIPRTLAVIGVFLVVIALILLVLLLLIPALIHQVANFVASIPNIIDWIEKHLAPYLSALGISPGDYDIETLKREMVKYKSQASALAKWMWQTLFHSTTVILHWLMNVLIILVAAFYLLRDWHRILKAITSLIPLTIAPTFLRLMKRCDVILSTFVRGQLLVMVALGAFFSLGLTIIGVNFALLLGVMAGILSIVPYLGTILGVGAALVAAYIQFDSLLPLVWVLVVFGIGHILEIGLLAPILVGDKLGLHPVAVIFAILAGGHLLGLAGVILALPLTAILVVLLGELLHNISNSPPVSIVTPVVSQSDQGRRE